MDKHTDKLISVLSAIAFSQEKDPATLKRMAKEALSQLITDNPPCKHENGELEQGFGWWCRDCLEFTEKPATFEHNAESVIGLAGSDSNDTTK